MANVQLEVFINGNNEVHVRDQSGTIDNHKVGHNDTVTWAADPSTVDDFEIVFEVSPFSGSLLRKLDDKGSKNQAVTETVDPNAPPPYKYTAYAKKGGKAGTPNDPHIIVSDNGAPGGSALSVLGRSGGDLADINADALSKIVGNAILDTVAKTLQNYKDTLTDGDKKRFFFPFGIQEISVEVNVLNVADISITVSGNTQPSN